MNWVRLVFGLLLGRRLPTTSGTLQVPGIQGPITIRRDRFGVAYIEAGREEDAWYGLGFCQGQDRAFQIEMLMRVARGTLAELIGEAGLPTDRLSRRLGFLHAARGHLEVLEPEVRPALEGFVKGINAGKQLGCRRIAHEFALLRAKPSRFEVLDLLAGWSLISFSLSPGWKAKLSRMLLLQKDGSEALRALGGTYGPPMPVSHPVGTAAGPALDRLAQDLSGLLEILGPAAASNNWAVNASRSRTGRPLLANDPHLGASCPSPWYLAHLRAPTLEVAGACFAGSPFFAAGHNAHAAWGMTAGEADISDLYLEELSADGTRVRDGDQFVPCVIRREQIQVKGRDPVEEIVVTTPRGPIISPVLAGDLPAISVRFTWMAPRSIGGLLDLHRADSFQSFRRALEGLPLISRNMIYADVHDTIGWQLSGQVPERKTGWGTLPLPGWDPERQWQPEPIPFDQMPFVENPPAGFVATANNQPIPDSTGPYLGHDWADGYRQARITEVLGSRSDWDLKGMQRLQMDQFCVPWREMREAVLAALAGQNKLSQARDMLLGWDGVLAAGSPAAAVYQAFVAEMVLSVGEAKAPNYSAWVRAQKDHPLTGPVFYLPPKTTDLVRLLCEQPRGWMARSWPVEIAAALDRAVSKLAQAFGPEPQAWAWGQIRPLILSHAMGTRPPLDRVFNLGPIPWGGDSHTVSVAGLLPAKPTANPVGVANLRMVLDVGNWEENRFVLAGGQSGNPLSPHYADQLELWARGDGITLAWSREAIGRVTQRTLRLVSAQ